MPVVNTTSPVVVQPVALAPCAVPLNMVPSARASMAGRPFVRCLYFMVFIYCGAGESCIGLKFSHQSSAGASASIPPGIRIRIQDTACDVYGGGEGLRPDCMNTTNSPLDRIRCLHGLSGEKDSTYTLTPSSLTLHREPGMGMLTFIWWLTPCISCRGKMSCLSSSLPVLVDRRSS